MPEEWNRGPDSVQINEESDLEIGKHSGGYAVREAAGSAVGDARSRQQSTTLALASLLILVFAGFLILWAVGVVAWSTPLGGIALGWFWLVILLVLLAATLWSGWPSRGWLQ